MRWRGRGNGSVQVRTASRWKPRRPTVSGALFRGRENDLFAQNRPLAVAFNRGDCRGREDRSGRVRKRSHPLSPIRRAAASIHNSKIWRDIQRSQPTLTVTNIRRSARL